MRGSLRRRKEHFENLHAEACQLAKLGQLDAARELYARLQRLARQNSETALICSDLAAIAAIEGKLGEAREGFAYALTLDAKCHSASANTLITAAEPATGDVPQTGDPGDDSLGRGCRVAVVSFFFNWPTTGGGNIHTAELARFLQRAGYVVRHIYPRYRPWGIGNVSGSFTFPSDVLEFEDSTWTVPEIQSRFRRAVDEFAPDWVIITDCWNFKPLLAEAVAAHPYILRQQALECLCPLNNLRFLSEDVGRARQCPLNQLETSQECCRCLELRGRQSGGLHQLDRQLSGVGTADYEAKLRRALREAQAVLVLNPVAQEMLRPHCRSVQVVTWGMDPARFPHPSPDDSLKPRADCAPTLLFAGLVPEVIKGFHILQEACAKLRNRGCSFDLLATADPRGQINSFTRYVGWLTQNELPRQIRAADILVMPTIAQEGLGRTTVEAMAAGRPVIASRIGGLPYTVVDGVTGLLCEPGNVDDLAAKLEMLLNDRELRERMGRAGRRRFEQEFTWDVVIERQYRPLLSRKPHAH